MNQTSEFISSSHTAPCRSQASALTGCVTSRVSRTFGKTQPALAAGEGIVIMAKSYHLGNETEAKFIECVGDSIGKGNTGLRVVPNTEFVDASLSLV